MKKRGQAAMEFLMTYGWAILIILVVVAALYYLGLFDSDTQASAQFGTGPFTAQDVRITENGVRLTVKAMGISAASVASVSVDGNTCTLNEDISQAARSSYDITCPVTLPKGKKVSGTITLSYTPLSGVSHNVDGTFSGTVEKSNPSITPLKLISLAPTGQSGISYSEVTLPATTMSLLCVSPSVTLGTFSSFGVYTKVLDANPACAVYMGFSSVIQPTGFSAGAYYRLRTSDNRIIKVYIKGPVSSSESLCVADDGSTYSTTSAPTGCATLSPANLRQAAP